VSTGFASAQSTFLSPYENLSFSSLQTVHSFREIGIDMSGNQKRKPMFHATKERTISALKDRRTEQSKKEGKQKEQSQKQYEA
jgi:hypothetical protein